jgi:hypothetical protein
MPTHDKEARMSEAYRVEVDTEGCKHCAGGRMWTIVGSDGVAIGSSWGDQEFASDIADLMNMAFDAGKETTLSAERRSATLDVASRFGINPSSPCEAGRDASPSSAAPQPNRMNAAKIAVLHAASEATKANEFDRSEALHDAVDLIGETWDDYMRLLREKQDRINAAPQPSTAAHTIAPSQEGVGQGDVAAAAPLSSVAPSYVWSVANKTTFALFGTEESANAYVSSSPASVGGGMVIAKLPVFGVASATREHVGFKEWLGDQPWHAPEHGGYKLYDADTVLAARAVAIEECAKVCDDYQREGEPGHKAYEHETAAELAARIRARPEGATK